MAIINSITGICIKPLTAMISPKSKLKALVMKLLTVMVKPEVNAKRHPKANLILGLLRSLANSSSDKRLSSTENKITF